jgi:drug/metabolite transporter (DMT)-like permease
MMPSRLVGDLLIALLCLIWGSTWIVIKFGLEDMPPLTSAGIRFALAAMIMTAATAWLGRREGGVRPPRWLSVALGLTSFALSYSAVYWSETRLPSGIVSVLWSVFPMLMAVSGHFFLTGETLRMRQWLGFVVGFIGVWLLFVTDVKSFGAGAIPAALVMLLSPLAATVGTTLVKRYGSGASSLALNRDGMWIGALVLCAAAWLTERDAELRWTGAAILGISYLAIVGTAVAFGLYFWLLRHMPANHLSLISYVTPAVALVLGAAFGETPITRYTVAGSLLILVGIALVVRGKASAARAAAELEPVREP